MASENWRKERLLIYLSHFLTTWRSKQWDFAVGLYTAILYPDSLLLSAILGFSIAFAIITYGSLIGNWIDRTKRIKVATSSIIAQNVAVAFGCAALGLNFAFKDEIEPIWEGNLQYVIYAVIIGAAIISQLGYVAAEIAIERDWIVILADEDESKLASMNSTMRIIDLTTKILTPVTIGLLISYWSQMAGAIFIGCWNVVSGFLEIYLLRMIYSRIPHLATKTVPSDAPISSYINPIKDWWDGWRLYMSHPVKWAGIGLSCLYLTVLGFDQITIGYMYNEGVNEGYIGILNGMGSFFGILGSISYPFLRKSLGGNASAYVGYVTNSIFQFICVISIFMPDSPFETSSLDGTTPTPGESHQDFTIQDLWEQRRSIFYFALGIILTRFGLWVADLSVSQILQDNVEESKRGIINGVQNSMQQTFDLLKFLLVILLPSPQTFGYLVILTWVASCAGGVLHFIFSMSSRKGQGQDNGKSKTSTRSDNSRTSKRDDKSKTSTRETDVDGDGESMNEQTPLIT